MSQHTAIVHWTHDGGNFLKGAYSREHTWTFDGGQTIRASPSPAVVPEPYSNPAGVDPEEAFVASVASCHMLTFLHRARLARVEVDSYDDEAVGVLAKNAEGALWVATVELRPRIVYRGQRPSPEQEQQLHHEAHLECFIANSVRTVITVSPVED